jgi:hypothetical protein
MIDHPETMCRLAERALADEPLPGKFRNRGLTSI